jgi:hypothetical protein
VPILIFVQVAIITFYVKGFKFDLQKVENVGASQGHKWPRLINAGIGVIIGRLNRSAYLSFEGV